MLLANQCCSYSHPAQSAHLPALLGSKIRALSVHDKILERRCRAQTINASDCHCHKSGGHSKPTGAV